MFTKMVRTRFGRESEDTYFPDIQLSEKVPMRARSAAGREASRFHRRRFLFSSRSCISADGRSVLSSFLVMNLALTSFQVQLLKSSCL